MSGRDIRTAEDLARFEFNTNPDGSGTITVHPSGTPEAPFSKTAFLDADGKIATPNGLVFTAAAAATVVAEPEAPVDPVHQAYLNLCAASYKLKSAKADFDALSTQTMKAGGVRVSEMSAGEEIVRNLTSAEEAWRKAGVALDQACAAAQPAASELSDMSAQAAPASGLATLTGEDLAPSSAVEGE